MTHRRVLSLLILVCLLMVAAPVTAVTSPSGIDPRLRLEWEPGHSRSGQPTITGYIYNDYGRAAMNVRLLVESLDASGQVVGRSIGYVQGIVPVSNRNYFTVPLHAAGANYRVTVTSFEWRDCGI